MKLIISPAKKMNICEDSIQRNRLPAFLDRTRGLMDYVRSLSFEEAKTLWQCNQKLAELNFRRFQEMDLERRLTPAILSYEGIQYQYMAPHVFDQGCLDYVQDHLRILSGFYGILKPLDGVVPYRLEMQAKIQLPWKGQTCKSLYDFWGDLLFKELTAEDPVIINLASKEYSKAIEPFLRSDHTMIHVVFGSLAQDLKGGQKVKVKATEAKMARGEMVRYLAEIKARCPEDLKGFQRLDYRFCPERSDETHYVFVK